MVVAGFSDTPCKGDNPGDIDSGFQALDESILKHQKNHIL
jgi:hypothetical protein